MRIEQGQAEAGLTLLLAHGAGAGMKTSFTDTSAEGIACRGLGVVRFEFPYMQKASEIGRRRPPNAAQVIERDFLREMARLEGHVVLGGKFRGGRIASVIAAS